jgi:hypothetical protein
MLVEGAVGGGKNHPGGDEGAGTADASLHDPDRLPRPTPGVDRDAILSSEDDSGLGLACGAALEKSCVETQGNDECDRNATALVGHGITEPMGR